MKCPVCTTTDLLMSERQGIEIDYCPQCRGVWLDRGELDKIIERSTQQMEQAAPQPRQYYKKDKHHEDDHDDHHYHKKRKSWLYEIFD